MVDKGIPLRLVLYSVAIVYLVLDLFVLAGPLRKALFRKSPKSAEVIAAAKAQGVVARVYFQPILLSQVDRRVEEDLWRAGRSWSEVQPEERRLLRRAALGELIDLHLLRMKVRFNQARAEVADAEVQAAREEVRGRFASEDEFRTALARRGWSEDELAFRLAARLQQERYLASRIEVQVGEEEAREWFETNRDLLALPARVRARHIFLTDREDGQPARDRLQVLLVRLEAGELGFEEAAAEFSEDERTRGSGGDLGWLQAGRVPGELSEVLFDLEVGERRVLSSRMGWHLVEVVGREPRAERTYGDAREDVLAALEAVKRREGLAIYRRQLRERDKHKIEIFEDVLERDRGTDEEDR